MPNSCEPFTSQRIDTLTEFYEHELATVLPNAPIGAVLKLFMDQKPQERIYVIGPDGLYAGQVRFSSVVGSLFPFHARPGDDNDDKHKALTLARLSVVTMGKAADLIDPAGCVLHADDTVEDLAHYVIRCGEDCFPVVGADKKLQGQLSLHRILQPRMNEPIFRSGLTTGNC